MYDILFYYITTKMEEYQLSDISSPDAEVMRNLQLKMVPVEEKKEVFEYDSVDELLTRAKGKYASGTNKEGIVIRPVEPVYSKTIERPLSMKILNNDYLLKE